MQTLISSFTLFFTILFFAAISQDAKAQIRPNLAVSAIVPQGALTQGSGNKIRVSISNSGMVGVNGTIAVVMKLTQGRKNKVVQRTLSGIGANDRNGQSVVFDNLTISSAGSVRVQVDIDPKRRIAESSRRDNRRVKTFQVASQPSVVAGGATLTTQVYHKGTWGYQGSNTFKGIANASVLVKKNGSTLQNGTTDSSGRWQANGVSAGTITVEVKRYGFQTKVKTFNLGSSNKVLNFDMQPGG